MTQVIGGSPFLLHTARETTIQRRIPNAGRVQRAQATVHEELALTVRWFQGHLWEGWLWDRSSYRAQRLFLDFVWAMAARAACARFAPAVLPQLFAKVFLYSVLPRLFAKAFLKVALPQLFAKVFFRLFRLCGFLGLPRRVKPKPRGKSAEAPSAARPVRIWVEAPRPDVGEHCGQSLYGVLLARLCCTLTPFSLLA